MAGSEVNSLADLLQHCGLDGELSPPPEVTLGGLDALLEEGRPKALAYLKDQGFEKLVQRQKLVNEFSKAKREGRISAQAMRGVALTPSAPTQPTKLAEPIDVSEAAPAAEAAPSPATLGQLRWLVDISDWEPSNAEWQLLLKALPEEDATKVMRFRFVADQKRALTSRYLQRRACFETTGVPWSSVEIARTKGGKPFMTNKPSPPTRSGLHANWNFNVSHEGKYVALAAEPRMVCGVDVAAPEDARAGKKKRSFSDTIQMMKGQLAPDEWRVINEGNQSEHKQEEAFRKFWSLKEAFTKGRGDGLGFEFNRCAFSLGESSTGTAEQPVQRATVAVDTKAVPLWGFYIQPLEADHWISTARGPPSAIVDAHGQFTKTFAEFQMSDAAVSEQLAQPEPPFEMKTIAELVPDEMRAELERARA